MDLFNQARRRYIVPLAALVLYDFVDPQKRADVAQALTAAVNSSQRDNTAAVYVGIRSASSRESESCVIYPHSAPGGVPPRRKPDGNLQYDPSEEGGRSAGKWSAFFTAFFTATQRHGSLMMHSHVVTHMASS